MFKSTDQSHYIYQAIKKDERYIPPIRTVVAEFPTEKQTIEYLQENGGGIYHNILHNLDCSIKPIKK